MSNCIPLLTLPPDKPRYGSLTDIEQRGNGALRVTGTDTKRRVEKLGGTYYGVGSDAGVASNHPAVDAVKAMCSQFGKTPKRTAKVRVFPTESRPATMDVLVAAIRAADFKDDELKRLFMEVSAAA